MGNGELRRELRRTSNIKGITWDGDCCSERTSDVRKVAQASEAAENTQTGLRALLRGSGKQIKKIRKRRPKTDIGFVLNYSMV